MKRALELFELSDREICALVARNVNSALALAIYANFAEKDGSVTKKIDLTEIFDSKTIKKKDRSELVKAFRELLNSGLFEQISSSNWKHHEVLIHPILEQNHEKTIY